jgi:hypothetical protein
MKATTDWQARLRKRDRMERKRERRLQQKAQKFHLVDKLPDVIRTVWGYNARRRKLSSIAHGATP